MIAPACSLWWLLAAVLLGWLLCGWIARQSLLRVTGGAAEKDREMQRLRAELAELRAGATAAASPGVDVAAARAAGPDLDGADDLRLIEGVGPKIARIFQAAGIRSFAHIAAMAPADIQPLLDEAGPAFRIADPQTWPEQAALAAAQRWAELKALQDALVGGRRVSPPPVVDDR